PNSGPQSHALDRVLRLAEERGGGLWIRLLEPTLVRYQNDLFASMRMHPEVDALATAMAPATDGALLFATRLAGILKWNGSQFESLAPKSALPASPIVAIAASENDVWLGTVDAGLLRLRSGVIIAMTAGLPDLRINCLLPGDRDEVYVGTNRGLARWDGTQF